MKSACAFVTHEGKVLDCTIDPPIVIEREAHAAVRRWRLGRLFRAFPHLLPSEPDFVHRDTRGPWPPLGANGWGPAVPADVLDFSDIVHGLGAVGWLPCWRSPPGFLGPLAPTPLDATEHHC